MSHQSFLGHSVDWRWATKRYKGGKILLRPSRCILSIINVFASPSVTRLVNAIDSKGHPIDGEPSGHIKNPFFSF